MLNRSSDQHERVQLIHHLLQHIFYPL